MTMVYSRYENYKDSGVSWLRMVPVEWTVIALKHYLLIPVTDGPHETPEFIDKGVPFISAEAIKNAKINFNKKRGFISKEADAIYSRKYKPKRGDIFIVKSGATTGNVAMVEVDDHFNIWSPLAVVRPNPKYIHGRYLFHFLCSENFKISIELGWSFGTQQNIGMNVIENIQVVLPPISEQKTIAEFLDRKTAEIDALIERKQTLLKLLEEKRTALITQAVTKGYNYSLSMKNSGIPWLGSIPEKWNVVALKRYLSIPVTDGPHETPDFLDEGISFISAEAIKSSKINFEKKRGFISKEASAIYSRKYKPQRGDIYIVKSGATTGNVAMVDTDEHFNIWSPLAAVRANSIYIHNRYLFYFLCSENFKISIELSWSFGTQQNIGMNIIENLRIVVPSLSEQKEIANFLDKKMAEFDDIKVKIEVAITCLKEYRGALITDAVTGKINVTEMNKCFC